MRALSKREKILAAAVAPLLLVAIVLIGRSLFSAWWGPIERLRANRQNLLKEIKGKETRVKRTKKTQARLEEFNRRSLPSDPAIARSLYQNWLFGLSDEVGFRGTKVDVAGEGRSRGSVYLAPHFTVKAGATLEKLVDFLHRFESADLLHQIRSLSIQTTSGSSNLDLTIIIEALSLPGAEPDLDVAVEVTGGSFDTVTNYTPDLKAKLVYTGRDGKLTDKAEFRLTGDRGSSQFKFDENKTLNDVRDEINKKTDETGVVATVDGDKLSLERKALDSHLPKHLEAIAARNLFAPYKPPPPTPSEGPGPPEPPKFDPGKYAYVTAIVGINDEPEAWVNARTTGKTFKLREGDTFDVGEIHAKVIHINRRGRNAEIEFDGKRWLVFMGDNLREAKPLFDEPGQ